MKNENRLLSEIADVLHAHEDGYADGAWEAFLKKRKRRRAFIYFRMAGAAAVLLLLGYAALLFMPQKSDETNVVRTKNQIKKPPYNYQPKNMQGEDSIAIAKPTTPVTRFDNGPAGATKQQPKGSLPFPTDNPVENHLPGNALTAADKPAYVAADNVVTKVSSPKDSVPALSDVTKNQQAPPPMARVENKRPASTERLSYDELANRGKPKPAPVKHGNNLSYALMLSPSVGNEKMNFGTGVEIAYNINKNLSVSSGLAYATMHAAADRSQPSENTQAYASNYAIASPRVQGVNISLSGFEVPLNVQYKTNSGFYVSAGISAVSVVKNNLSYNYLSNRAAPQYSASGSLTTKIEVVSENTTSESPEKVNGYIGFYTFSAGKKINFGKGKLNFAPFIKIPFGPVSSENLQLMQGGIQLGIGF